MEENKRKPLSRRDFLKLFGIGSVATAAAVSGCKKPEMPAETEYKQQVEPPVGKMTYRVNPKTKEKVSLLGYGMMRLPEITGKEEYDQEMIN